MEKLRRFVYWTRGTDDTVPLFETEQESLEAAHDALLQDKDIKYEQSRIIVLMNPPRYNKT